MPKFKVLFISLATIIVLQLCILVLKHLGFGLVYNASKSMSRGVYVVIPAKKIQRNDIVVFYPPFTTQQFLSMQHWGPGNHLLMKHVLGLPGDWVCKRKNTLWINQNKVANVLVFYATNKKIPQVDFCGYLTVDQYLLLSTNSERSFDGRYFGPVQRQNIKGKAVLLLLRLH